MNNKIEIISYKHNGDLHRVWHNANVVRHNEKEFVVVNDHSNVIDGDGRRWKTKEPAVCYFYKDYWFNVICMLRSTGIHYYCNIASPYEVQDNVITYIDYDLDVGLNSSGQIKILDEIEYNRHKKELNYSLELDYLLKKALYEVLNLCKERKFPFDDTKIEEFYKLMKMICQIKCNIL